MPPTFSVARPGISLNEVAWPGTERLRGWLSSGGAAGATAAHATFPFSNVPQDAGSGPTPVAGRRKPGCARDTARLIHLDEGGGGLEGVSSEYD